MRILKIRIENEIVKHIQDHPVMACCPVMEESYPNVLPRRESGVVISDCVQKEFSQEVISGTQTICAPFRHNGAYIIQADIVPNVVGSTPHFFQDIEQPENKFISFVLSPSLKFTSSAVTSRSMITRDRWPTCFF